MGNQEPEKILRLACSCGHPIEAHVEIYDGEGALRDAYCTWPDCDANCRKFEVGEDRPHD